MEGIPGTYMGVYLVLITLFALFGISSWNEYGYLIKGESIKEVGLLKGKKEM